MVKRIRLYIEGGFDSYSRTALRKGFKQFLAKGGLSEKDGVKIDAIFCGSRNSAYEDFCQALQDHREALVVLLVDAESLVERSPWHHLGWDARGATNEQCHLMVQIMEAWFIADKKTLQEYFGQGFQTNALPKDIKIERVEKGRIFTSLEKATRNTTKKSYNKTRDAPRLLEQLNPDIVRRASDHCDRLFKVLLATVHS